MQIVQDQFDPQYTISTQQEFDGIMRKGFAITLDKLKLPQNVNTIPSRFIITIKDPGTDSQLLRALWT